MEKKVLITGGNKGIGLETTDLFLKSGYRVIVVGRDFENFRLKDNSKVHIIPFELSKTEEIPELVTKIGDIDILINNAGYFTQYTYDSYPEDEVEKIIRVNLRTPVALIREFSQSFIKKRKGRIVNVASLSAETGHGDIWYGLTKAGLVNATKSFAAILGKHGVVVNAVAPGPVQTKMMDNSAFAERFDKIKNRVYLGRHALPVEVARTIYWLATESPDFINGETIDINNGVRNINL